MEEDDRFYSILVTNGVRYPGFPNLETVLTFFAIRRANGLFDIINVMKTFEGEKVTLRNVQTKSGIKASQIAGELTAIISTFGGAIEAASGIKLTWHKLDLKNVPAREEQVRLIKEWGRVGVITP